MDQRDAPGDQSRFAHGGALTTRPEIDAPALCRMGETMLAVGDYGLVAIRREGAWYVLPPPTNAHLYSIWGVDEDHVYAASSIPNEICFFDGRRWQPLKIEGPRLERMMSIWGTSPNNLFVLDYHGTLAHFDGRNWVAQERLFSEAMYGVSGNAGDVLTVGRFGSILYHR